MHRNTRVIRWKVIKKKKKKKKRIIFPFPVNSLNYNAECALFDDDWFFCFSCVLLRYESTQSIGNHDSSRFKKTRLRSKRWFRFHSRGKEQSSHFRRKIFARKKQKKEFAFNSKKVTSILKTRFLSYFNLDACFKRFIMISTRTRVQDGHDVRRPFRPAVYVTSSYTSHVRRARFQRRLFSRLPVGSLVVVAVVVVEHVFHCVPRLVHRRLDYLRRRLYVRPLGRRVLAAQIVNRIS